MSDFKGGGKAYPGKPDFFGDNWPMEKVTDAAREGTGVNVPDHADKKASELTHPKNGSKGSNQIYTP
jgi:hypothetical protein